MNVLEIKTESSGATRMSIFPDMKNEVFCWPKRKMKRFLFMFMIFSVFVSGSGSGSGSGSVQTTISIRFSQAVLSVLSCLIF